MPIPFRLAAVLAPLVLAGAPAAHGQCILANPSFELSGTGGAEFGGWNQFGDVGSSGNASHGALAARVSGPDLGGWDVSAYWQRVDSAPGDRWSASVRAAHSSSNPLTGDSRAILNIEWRDAGGALIDYESHTAADATTPADGFVLFSVESQAAPPGTAATHLLLGVLQSPTDPPPDVLWDEARFESLGPPTPEDLQWGDFPGGRTLSFGGRTWRVKGPGFYGPGPSLFCDSPSCTWVDANDRLHLTIQNVAGSWQSTEVVLEDQLGYGDYVFTTRGRLDAWHANVVFGLFLWEYGPCFEPENGWWNPYNEIDVEFSRWGDPANDVGQFVAQPWDSPGNRSRFDATFGDGELTSHAFRWLPDRVEFRSWRGGPEDEATSPSIHAWTYAGPHVPRPERPRVHVNLWQFGEPPTALQEVVLDAFTFVPDGGATAVPPVAATPLLTGVAPNPSRARTSIGWAAPASGPAELVVYDVTGRRVRTLATGTFGKGARRTEWNGRDDAGVRVAAGVYLVQLRAAGTVETRRLVLVR